MGLGDWLRRTDRRRSGAPVRENGEGTGRGGGGTAVPASATAPASGAASVSPAPASGEGDGGGWDGGWRRVAPPSVTVARSSIGVSDGLRFRSRLASWQNPTLGGELGHSVLPSAPVGLIHGVARPGSARTASPGGPLLLRAVRPQEADEPAGPTPNLPSASGNRAAGRDSRAGGLTGAASGTGAGKPGPGAPSVQRSAGAAPSAARGSSSGSAGRSGASGSSKSSGPSGASGASGPSRSSGPSGSSGSGASSRAARVSDPHTTTGHAHGDGPDFGYRARPAAVRPQRIAPPLIVARRPAMPLRQIAGLPPVTPVTPSGPAAPSAAPSAPAPAPAAPATAVQRAVSERPSGPDRTAPEPPSPDRASGPPAAEVVRPALGKPLRALPDGARPAGDGGPAGVGVVPSAPASTPPAAELPVLQRRATDPPSPPATPHATPRVPAPGSAQAQAKASARQQPTPDSRPRTSQPSQQTQSSQSSQPSQSARTSGPSTPSGPAPSVQRAPAPGGATPTASSPASRIDASGGSRARVRGGIGTPLPSLPPTARLGGDAPLLGDRTSPGTGTRPGPLRAPGHGPATTPGSGPVVPAHASAPQGPPAAMPVRSASAAPGAPAVPAPPSPGTAAVQRAAAPGPARTSSDASPPPVRIRPVARDRATPRGSGDTAPSLPPAVQRSRALLTERRLTVNTGSAEGFSAPPTAAAAGGGTARPVVAATWRRDVPQPGPADARTGNLPSARQPTPSGAVPSDPVQRSATTNPVHRGGGGPVTPGHAPHPTADATTDAAAPTPRGGVLQRLVRRSGRATNASPASPSAPQPGPAHRTAAAAPVVRRTATSPSAPSAPSAPAAPLPYARSARPGTPSAPSTPSGASASATAAGPRRFPVVRPHPPGAARPGADAVPVQRLAMPVVPDGAGPPAAGPAPVDGAAPAAPPGLSVRVPPRTPAQTAGAGRPESRAQAVQRAAANAGITGVPVQAAPAKPAVQRAGPAAGAEDGPDASPANRLSGTEIEELARRLLDPVSRLIRADLRRGRERSGRLHDGRR
ncbi:hypothetical protein PV749_17235 [Streptomyces sp. ID03-2B]|uniref:hypothetical protein n=1 Tax=Streptomyces sp. ID03-2B TaxID=3028660 RepID=UPI0029B4C22D|nr:hypothetical protein [Streptomyces sp. ID03-2B]MDX3592863.1 hypothetical protein [Streptomyces sp. ID03-2B]